MIKQKSFIDLISKGDFKELFISELGWNNARSQSELSGICVDDVDYKITAIAERSGFQILYCEVENIPTQSIVKRIDTKLRRQAADYICIYRKKDTAHDLWCVPVRSTERRNIVMVEYDNAKADFLYSKVDGFYFDLEEKTNIVDLCAKVQSAFAVNSEKITKEFYAGFKKQHTLFSKFISGIDDYIPDKDNRSKQWYASVMLNRLMFCYFIQKKGFLDGKVDYLQDKLKWVRSKEGKAVFPNFQSFYRSFLTRLFHDGLNTPKHSRDFVDHFGKIPYLNGGMFDEHQLERDYAKIDIADDAFESLFNFFDTWEWHLDTRITAGGKDINPDVLGYIFEQYINDRAKMGAYYTKEDITEYIGRNCILPFLFDKVTSTSSRKDFEPDGFVWQTLKASKDKYVFDAVKKGYADFDKIPKEIARGIITPKMHKEYSQTAVGQHQENHVPLSELREHWNQPTGETWALPTEIWRETIERLQRCHDVLTKIAEGKITSINDFITYNLDIRRFAIDIIDRADSRFVKHFYEALRNVSILDPTCGSGAFLFAAMNILEPLYEACIERMQAFNKENQKLFKAELDEINGKYRSNIQYFIYKSIILRNLYGVDIMVEATEIAKLRLFLKMVAVVDVDPRAPNLGLDPLPDIDFNIRCGNTLVGYANKAELDRDLFIATDILQELANQEYKKQIEKEMEIVSEAYEIFKDVQFSQSEDMAAFKQAKTNLQNRLSKLNDSLNHRLHQASSANTKYDKWLESHQPFNWLAEFYGIIQGNGGFDVIIGNPPYIEKRQVNYTVDKFATSDSGAIHSMCVERSLSLVKGSISMIVPIAIVCTQRMVITQSLIEAKHSVWYSNYAWRPAHLFDNVSRALTIFVAHRTNNKCYFSTNYIKWRAENRNLLFPQLHYVEFSTKRDSFWMPKFGKEIERSILGKVLSCTSSISCFTKRHGNNRVYYRTTGGVYWKTITTWSPKFFCNGKASKSSRETSFIVESSERANQIVGLLSSNLFWWWYTITSNLRDLNPSDIAGFRFSSNVFSSELTKVSKQYLKDIENNSIMQIRMQKTKGETETQLFKIGASKTYIDAIDRELAKFYLFTEEELDYIVNYDIKFRLREIDNIEDTEE